jgi:hypothetical protein
VTSEAFVSDYSYRSATIGSTFVARRAGSRLANTAKPMSTKAAATNVAGSAGEMPNTSSATVFRRTHALARPYSSSYCRHSQTLF